MQLISAVQIGRSGLQQMPSFSTIGLHSALRSTIGVVISILSTLEPEYVYDEITVAMAIHCHIRGLARVAKGNICVLVIESLAHFQRALRHCVPMLQNHVRQLWPLLSSGSTLCSEETSTSHCLLVYKQ